MDEGFVGLLVLLDQISVKSEQECVRCLNTLPLLDLAFSDSTLPSRRPNVHPSVVKLLTKLFSRLQTLLTSPV